MEYCLACDLNQHPENVPGGVIKEYEHWKLEHVVEPIPIAGWLILKTKRHVRGIMGMNKEEAAELAEILYLVPKILEEICEPEMIYFNAYTDLFEHLHFHIIPISFDEELKGPDIFKKKKEVENDSSKAIPLADCQPIIDRIRRVLQ